MFVKKKITAHKNLKWIQLTIKMCVVEIFEFREMVSFIKRPVVKGIMKVRVSVWMQHRGHVTRRDVICNNNTYKLVKHVINTRMSTIRL